MKRAWIVSQALILILIISNLFFNIQFLPDQAIVSKEAPNNDIAESQLNLKPNTDGSNTRSMTLNYGSSIIELEANKSKSGLTFQLQKNTTVINSTLRITGLPSFDYNTWDDLTVISTDSADGESDSPVVSIDGVGNSHVVWRDTGNIKGSGSDSDIVYTKNWGDSWQSLDVVSTAQKISESTSPDIFIDSLDRIHFVWVDDANYKGSGTDFDIFYRYKQNTVNPWSQDDWSDTFVISNQTGFGYSSNPKIAVNSSGDLFIVWKDNETALTGDPDFDILCRIRYRNNNTWSPTFILSDDVNDGGSHDPDIAVEGDSVHVVWTDDGDIQSSGFDQDIILRTWNGSAWEDMIVVSDDPNDDVSSLPVIAAQDSVICIAWVDAGDINNSGFDNDIILKKFSNSQWLDSIVISDASYDMNFNSTAPEIKIDIEGNVHVTWSDDVLGIDNDIDMDIIYRRWDAATDKWSNYILISNNPDSGDSYEPVISVNNEAKVEILWLSNIFEYGFDKDIFYRSSKFIYPTNLKLRVSRDENFIIDNENYDWIYPDILDEQIEINGSLVCDAINSNIDVLNGQIGNGYLVFSSDTNGSLKINDFETFITSTPMPPTDLRIIGEDQDHIISHTPDFSWKFFDNDSKVQGGFELQVGSDIGIHDMWYYGPLLTSNEYTRYNGKPLLDNNTYYFRVRVRDIQGAWSNWSQYQSFTMNARPEVRSLTPVSGTADEYIDIECSGSDGNDDELWFTLEAHYNLRWHELPTIKMTTHYRLNTFNIPASQAVDLRAKCFDGYEESEGWFNPDGSITIIHNNPPDVRIITPPKDNAVANDSYLILWESIDLDIMDTHKVNIYYDIDTNFTEKIEIVTNLSDTGTYLWDTKEVDHGVYYICIEISDFKSSRFKYSDGFITIDHTIDTSPPRVSTTYPKPGSGNVAINEEIRVQFNKEMDTKTITSKYFFVKDSLDRMIDGIIYIDNTQNAIIFYPNRLDYGQIYTVTVGAGIKDISGNSLDGNGDRIQQGPPIDDYIWTFSTVPWGGDISPPYILSVSPRDCDSEITVRPIVTAIFSENIAHESLNPYTVYILDPVGNFIDAEIIYFIPEQNELRISFKEDLEFETRYTILITAEVQDLAGRGLDGNKNGISQGSPVDDFVWSFTTKKADRVDGTSGQENNIGILDIYFIIITIIIILIIITVIVKQVKKEKFTVNDIFVIYDDGRLLAHQSFKSKSNVDETTMGGMLTAIQNFVTESFMDSGSEILEEIKYGKLKILLVHGKKIYLAVICSGDINKNKFNKDMQNLLSLIEAKFGSVLKHWDGNMNKVRDIQELIRF